MRAASPSVAVSAAAIAWSVKLTGLSLDKIVNLLLADDWRQRLS